MSEVLKQSQTMKFCQKNKFCNVTLLYLDCFVDYSGLVEHGHDHLAFGSHK